MDSRTNSTDAKILNGSGILNYDKYLKHTPADWPNVYIFRHDHLNTNIYLNYLLHPRFVRALRLTIGSIAAYYIALYPTGLGNGGLTIFVGMVYMGVSIMNGIYGTQTLGLLLLLIMALVLAFVFTTILVTVVLVNPNPGAVLATYVACMLVISSGRLGPMGIGGSISLNFIIMLASFIFFYLYDYALHGLHASIPLADLANSALLADHGTPLPIPELVDMLHVQFTAAVGAVFTFTIPASISTTLAGSTCSVSVSDDTLDILVEPGWWVIDNILWRGDNAVIAALGPMMWMVVVGLSIYLAVHLVPPYYSANREVRDILGRVLCSLIDKQTYARPKAIETPSYHEGQDMVSLDEQTTREGRGTKDKPSSNDFDAHFYAAYRAKHLASSPVGLLLGQAVQSALTSTNALLNSAANGEPHWFSPCVFVRTHDEMRAVDTRVGQLAASVILYNMYFSERNPMELNNPPELAQAKERLVTIARQMVDECGRSICTIPTLFNKALLTKLKEQLLQVHTDLQVALDHYNALAARVYEDQLNYMHRNGSSEAENKKVVVAMSASLTLIALNFHHHPRNLCVAVENLLDASHRYSLSNAVVSLYRLLFFYSMLLPKAMMAAFTTFFMALRTLPQRVSWTGPASWYQNRDLHHWLRFNLGTFILFVVPLYSAEFRDWVWPIVESTTPKYTDTPVLGHLQLWCIMTYVLCESATLEPTVQKCVWRMLGSAIGCVTAYLTLLAAGTDNPWVILLSSVIMHFIVCFAAADKDSTSVLWMQQRWNYLPGVVLITHIVIMQVFWIRRETFAMEFYVLNRFIASMAGALLCLGINSWVLPMSAGLASRNLFTRSYGALSASLAAAFTAIDSAAATAHPDPQTTPSVPTTAEDTDTDVPNISATEQPVPPLPNLDGALATLAGGEALLAGASFYSEWAHAGPVIVADERLRMVVRFLSALSHMAGNVRVVHELYAASDAVERAEQDVGKEKGVGTSSTSLLPGVGTAGDSMSLVEGAQGEADVDPAGSPGTSKKVLEVPHKRLRGVSINLVSARERVLDVIPECVQMFTGVLLSQSEQDAADIPVLSALTIDDKAKADNETALNALVRLQNNATDSSVHPSVEECVMSLLDTSFDLDEGANAVIQHMYENGAMATTLLALTTAMYLDYSRVCMEFLATHAHTPQRPTIQIALTAHNAKSRHFIRAVKMRGTDEESG